MLSNSSVDADAGFVAVARFSALLSFMDSVFCLLVFAVAMQLRHALMSLLALLRTCLKTV